MIIFQRSLIDSSKLREFNNFLMEWQSAKEDGALSRLITLDTANGIHPLVRKFPFSLQERWILWGSEYKDRNCVPFPPFTAFVVFISYQAKVRNDPSFKVTLHNDRVLQQPQKRTISVNKTEVPFTAPVSPNRRIGRAKESNHYCPLHKASHSIQKCHTFHEKLLEEHLAFLKEKGICFRCCKTTLHMEKDCSNKIWCAECNSKQHSTALHPGPPP